jgi:BTB/POZ domain-containing protein KCTD9
MKKPQFMSALRQSAAAIFSVISKSQLSASLFIFFCATLVVALIAINYDASIGFSWVPDLGLYNSPDFWQNVIVEAHGMLLDIFVIGILLLWLDNIGKKKQEIKRYLEVIEDYRYWKSEEASLIITANIKRLLAHGITKINLHNCYLKGRKLKNVDLSGSILTGIDLGEADLRQSKLQNVKLEGSYLSDAKFQATDLSNGTELIRCRCSRTGFRGAKFNNINMSRSTFDIADLESVEARNSNMTEVVFFRSNLKGVDFRGADLTDVDFEGSILQSADLRETKNLNVKKLLEASTLWKTKLDDEIKAQVLKINPALLNDRLSNSKTIYSEFLKEYKREKKAGKTK